MFDIGYIRLLFFNILFSWCFMFCINNNVTAYDFQSFADNLAESGHRDIQFVRDGTILKIFYWPVGFRSDYNGYENIKNKTLKLLPVFRNIGIKRIDIIQTAWGIPVVTSQLLTDCTSERISFTKKYFPDLYDVNTYYPAKKGLLFFDIPLKANFGQFYDPFIFKTGIGHRFTYRLSDAVLANFEVDFFLHNEYDLHEYYKPGNIGIMAARTISEHMISFTNIGVFRQDIYGIDQEFFLSMYDDILSINFHGGLYGEQRFENHEFKYKKISHKLALLKMTYSDAAYDCRITLMGGRFLFDDKGFGAVLSRTFREVEIGFTGIKTGGDLVLNVFFSVPLYPQSRSMLAKHGIGHVKHFKMKYWYYSNNLGREPHISTRRQEINGLANPAHYKFMSQRYK